MIKQESREVLASFYRARHYGFVVTIVALFVVLAMLLLGNALTPTVNSIASSLGGAPDRRGYHESNNLILGYVRGAPDRRDNSGLNPAR